MSNNGVSDADGTIVVTDTLPTGVVPQSATGTGWTCDITGQDVTCEHPAGLAASDTAGIITLVAAVDPSFTGTLSNTATVTGPTADPNPGNNTSTATASTGTSADLAIAKVHTGDMTAGTSDSYTLTVTNLGPSDAQNVVVTDTLPAGLTATGAAGPGWTCTVTGGDQVECTRATLASGATRTVTIDVDIDPGVTGEVVNTARVTSDTFDPVPANNESTDTTTSNARADLAVTKSHSGTAVAGQPLTFTLEVTNLGPSNSPTVTVIDTIPAGMSATNAAGPGWSCDITGQTVTCVRAGGLARGASSSITLDVDLAPDADPATLTNEATVTGPLADPVLGNNKVTDDVSVLDRGERVHREGRHRRRPGQGRSGHVVPSHRAQRRPVRRGRRHRHRHAPDRHDRRRRDDQRLVLLELRLGHHARARHPRRRCERHHRHRRHPSTRPCSTPRRWTNEADRRPRRLGRAHRQRRARR